MIRKEIEAAARDILNAINDSEWDINSDSSVAVVVKLVEQATAELQDKLDAWKQMACEIDNQRLHFQTLSVEADRQAREECAKIAEAIACSAFQEWSDFKSPRSEGAADCAAEIAQAIRAGIAIDQEGKRHNL